MIKKTFVSIALLVIFLSVYFSISSDFVYERYRIQGDEAQNILYKKLKSRGVMFEVDDDGSVIFSPSDREIVHKMADEAILESKGSTTTIKYPVRKYSLLLIKKLRNGSIHYDVDTVDGEIVITLYGYNRAQWKRLVAEVDEVVINDATSNLGQ